MAQILIDEGAAPGTPSTGVTALYVKADGRLYTKDDAGTERIVGDVVLSIENVWLAQQTPMNGTLTDGATVDWNGDTNGQSVKLTLGGNRTMNAPTNINEYAAYVIRVIQDGTGSRTLAWNSAFKFAGGTAPTLTTTASAVDVFTFIGGGSNVLYCVGQTMDVK